MPGEASELESRVLSPTEFEWALDNVVGSYDASYVTLVKSLRLIPKAGNYINLIDKQQALTLL